MVLAKPSNECSLKEPLLDIELERLALSTRCAAHHQHLSHFVGKADSDWKSVAEVASVVVDLRQAEDVCEHRLDLREVTRRAQHGHEQWIRCFWPEIRIDAWRISSCPKVGVALIKEHSCAA